MKRKVILSALKLQAGQARTEELEGKSFYVVPSVILLEGVHCPTGQGPDCMYYPPSEIQASAALWDNVPIVIQHPFDANGNPVSARTPDILNRQGVGRLFNTRYDAATTKLHSELWLDLERVQAIDADAAQAITGGAPLDVSHAAFTSFEERSGTWNEEHYDGIVAELAPDHLALLPGTVGACSWADGCGVRASGKGDKGMTFKISIADDSPLKKAGKWLSSFVNALFSGDQSHEELRGKIQGLLDAMDGGGWLHFTREIFDGYIIYVARTQNPSVPDSGTTKMYRQDYRVDGDNVEFVGTPQEVTEERRYVSVGADGGADSANIQRKGPEMNKAEQVAALVANKATPFTIENQPLLDGMTECQLTALAAVKYTVAAEDPPAGDPPPTTPEPAAKPDAPAAAPAAAPEPAPTVSKAKTVDEYIAEAPVAMQGTLRRAVERDQQVKDDLVTAIMANKANTFTEDALKAKDVDELNSLAALAQVDVDYSAQGGAPRVSEESEVPDPPLAFETKRKAPAAA